MNAGRPEAQHDQRNECNVQASRNTPHLQIDKEGAGRQDEMVATSVVWDRPEGGASRAFRVAVALVVMGNEAF